MSQIYGCKMLRQFKNLPFKFERGSCNTFETPEQKAMLCFGYDGYYRSKTRSCHLLVILK